ncbi:MAG: hypothetical protein LBQ41_00875 [Candidatus Ancillula sp.]|nr:hypothetical protein [Candidatus Ancillula sp.]
MAVIVEVVVQALIKMVTRVFFLHYLSAQYLGFESSVTSWIGAVGIVEVLLTSGLTYPLMASVAKEDFVQAKAVNKLLSKYYKYIGVFVIAFGIIISPFVPVLLQKEQKIDNMMTIYFILIAGVALNYFLRGKTLFFAVDQRGYILQNLNTFISIFINVSKVAVLIVTQDILIFAIATTIITLIQRAISYCYAEYQYGFIENFPDEEINPEYKQKIKKNSAGAFIGIVCVSISGYVDNILIIWYTNLAQITLLYNYQTLMSVVGYMINSLISGLAAGVGHLVNTEGKEKQFQFYKYGFFLQFFSSVTSMIFFTACINPFIAVWLGQQYVLPGYLVAIIIVPGVFSMAGGSLSMFIGAAGEEYRMIKVNVSGVVLNIVFSLFFVMVLHWGVAGVLLGTIIGNFIPGTLIGPRKAFHIVFNMSYWVHLRLFFKYFSVTCIASVVTYIITQLIDLTTDDKWYILFTHFFVALVVWVITLASFWRTDEFQYFYRLAIRTLKWGKKKGEQASTAAKNNAKKVKQLGGKVKTKSRTAAVKVKNKAKSAAKKVIVKD